MSTLPPHDADLLAMGQEVGQHVAAELASQQRRQERQAYVSAALPIAYHQAPLGASFAEVATLAVDLAEALLAELERRDGPQRPHGPEYYELSGPPQASPGA